MPRRITTISDMLSLPASVQHECLEWSMRRAEIWTSLHASRSHGKDRRPVPVLVTSREGWCARQASTTDCGRRKCAWSGSQNSLKYDWPTGSHGPWVARFFFSSVTSSLNTPASYPQSMDRLAEMASSGHAANAALSFPSFAESMLSGPQPPMRATSTTYYALRRLPGSAMHQYANYAPRPKPSVTRTGTWTHLRPSLDDDSNGLMLAAGPICL
ncbi:hypothetical protein BU26DRAFT_328681 [Trematosphaeria pertusa]|uniref:Uncharacterized protein n=1 Tax=Trematosphaeria pertusa TaxID=390896 RepID=A0A6A6ID94_9PLEO|nr:uncharacterized protein BU26DRAFT_328681 [Trematosphaeria pertusa]KAF2248179.1 hypothetical protein BU26DRAFT_328681 [Trematosphaeria pertusa]